MNDRKFEIIQELMGELKSLMEPGAEDFSERLGRPKPAAVEVEVEAEPLAEEEPELEIDGDEVLEGPDAKLKQRIMKLRG